MEGTVRRSFDINFNIITINAPVNQSQIAVGKDITQSQTVSINSFGDLYKYLDEKLDKSQNAALKPLIEQLEADVKTGSIKPSNLRRIAETIKNWTPVAVPIIDAIAKLIGLKP